jgi:SAM-dependent methyltransferase
MPKPTPVQEELSDHVKSSVKRIQAEDARLTACLRTGNIDIGVLWEVCVYHEFNRRETVSGIADWLGSPGVLRILDCACGSGFPALDLAMLGYDIEASDGSEIMLNHFRRNAQLLNSELSARLVTWEHLVDSYGEEAFDVIMCRGGGSYLYAGTWDVDAPPDRAALGRTFSQFARVLRPGGQLYVDITRPETLLCEDTGWVLSPPLNVAGQSVDLQERITLDRVERTRRWNSRLRIGGSEAEFCRTSHLVTGAELCEIMTGAGLQNPRRVNVTGETYHVYVAEHPEEGLDLRHNLPR